MTRYTSQPQHAGTVQFAAECTYQVVAFWPPRQCKSLCSEFAIAAGARCLTAVLLRPDALQTKVADHLPLQALLPDVVLQVPQLLLFLNVCTDQPGILLCHVTEGFPGTTPRCQHFPAHLLSLLQLLLAAADLLLMLLCVLCQFFFSAKRSVLLVTRTQVNLQLA